MRFVTDEKSKQEYKKFLETNERCNFQQSLEWAEVKKPNWIPEVILAEDEEKALKNDIQDLVNEYNKDIERLLKEKEQELMTI